MFEPAVKVALFIGDEIETVGALCAGIVSETVVVCDRLPLVPVIVIGYVDPPATVEATLNVATVCPPLTVVAGLNVTVTPAGIPDAE
jgi:hypothetical protein